MKLALAQMDVKPNQPEKNLETMLRMIEEAKREKIDLIVFPEMCVGGYLVGDKWTSDQYCANLMEYNEDIQRASQGIAIAFGNVYLDRQEEINQRVGEATADKTIAPKIHPNKDGRTRKYNAVYVYQNGKPAERTKETKYLPPGIHPKTLLPNYRFFDDERYFFSLEDVVKDFGRSLEELAQPFLIEVADTTEKKDGKEGENKKNKTKKIAIGFTVCEDLWCEDYRKNSQAENVTKILIQNGAEQMVSLSASPWTYGKNGARDRRIQFLKEDCGDQFVPFHYVNCTGVQNNGKNIITFDGGSTIYNSQGLPVKFSKDAYKEELMFINSEAVDTLPALTREESPRVAQKLEAIVAGLKHLKDASGKAENPKWVIGLSGGVDSSVVAAILTLAFGAEKVLGVNMPTEYNSAATKDAAAQVAQKLGIPYITVPISDLAKVNEELIDRYDLAGPKKSLTSQQKGNIAAKIRSTNILSSLAAKHNALFTGNGNKLEIALGYATLYGDVGGAIAPLGDMTKVEIWELARYLNEQLFHDEVIPRKLIPDKLCRFSNEQIQPTAELEETQVDPMKFGYHDALLEAFTDYKKKSPEDILRWYAAGTMEKNLGVSTAMIERWSIDYPKTFVDDLEWFSRQMDWAVFKRIQAPPIIALTKSAYGYDIRESLLPFHQGREYQRLREKVLAMEKYIPQECVETSKNAAARAKRRGEQSGEPEPVSGLKKDMVFLSRKASLFSLHRFPASSSRRQRDEKPAVASRAAQAAFFEGERRALRVAAASRLELSNSKADIPRMGLPPCRLAVEAEEARLKAAAIPLRSPELSTYPQEISHEANISPEVSKL